MVFFFKARDGKYRDYATKRKAAGFFTRRLDFGRCAPTGRRWGVQVGPTESPIPEGAIVAK